eukprot:Rmarinus@m.15384
MLGDLAGMVRHGGCTARAAFDLAEGCTAACTPGWTRRNFQLSPETLAVAVVVVVVAACVSGATREAATPISRRKAVSTSPLNLHMSSKKKKKLNIYKKEKHKKISN